MPSGSELMTVRGVDALRPSSRPAPQTPADVGRAKLSEDTKKPERPLDALRASLCAAPTGGNVLAVPLRCADGQALLVALLVRKELAARCSPNWLFQA